MNNDSFCYILSLTAAKDRSNVTFNDTEPVFQIMNCWMMNQVMGPNVLKVYYHTKFQDPKWIDASVITTSQVCMFSLLLLLTRKLKSMRLGWHNVHTEFCENQSFGSEVERVCAWAHMCTHATLWFPKPTSFHCQLSPLHSCTILINEYFPK
jgi:hypothetical protein